ncbi:LacI family DNA-binding transcriptional regulator [Leifsonia shinshuensis]|uniref:DNA-binding LacI/PurR family transcriptional regulator n=1 Tax=Leifsonia shinshuensis TaxID=150026 RepID=A0A853D453_9MICO|nr:LacI family DNA-binding transcriptional regulator [Leifsonia shinshuensis]NYJ25445.1 DNA-binding LacI/PurR family transcriptional regulator [Leifsonia shinshuensis]
MSDEGLRRERPTLSDVAGMAGTSVPTVSKVLRGGTDVSPATRARVMDAVHAVGYARSPRATAPRSSAPESDAPAMIDLVVDHVHGTWANGVLTGVESAATAAGVDVVITIARPDGNWVSRLLRRPSRGAVVVLVDPAPGHFAALEAAHIPVVLVTPMSEPSAPAMRVGVTNWDGGRTAAEHLLALGHQRFAVVGGTRAHLYSRARIDGFRSALEVAGGAGPTVVHGDWDRARAAEAIAPVLAGPDRPTAVFACSDLMAMGVYDAAKAAGLRVPDDLSVVGFDDVPEASWGAPPLTTIRQPIAEMGEVAVRLLLAASDPAAAPEAELARVDLSTSLVVRSSTARPAD